MKRQYASVPASAMIVEVRLLPLTFAIGKFLFIIAEPVSADALSLSLSTDHNDVPGFHPARDASFFVMNFFGNSRLFAALRERRMSISSFVSILIQFCIQVIYNSFTVHRMTCGGEKKTCKNSQCNSQTNMRYPSNHYHIIPATTIFCCLYSIFFTIHSCKTMNLARSQGDMFSPAYFSSVT